MVLLLAAPVQAQDVADAVCYNGKIYTMDTNQPWAEAVPIKGDRFLFVGSSDESKKLVDQANRNRDRGHR